MMTIPHIQRLIEAEAYERLIERILSNGRCDAPDIRRRLSQRDVLLPAALGLALQRCCELAYGPTAVAVALVGRLLDQKRGDGRFGSGTRESQLIATAISVRALADFADLTQRAASGIARLPLPRGEGRGEGASDRLMSAVVAAVSTSLAQLVKELDMPGLSPVAAAIVLWQLHDQPELRADWPAGLWSKLVHRAESAAAPASLHRFALAFAA